MFGSGISRAWLGGTYEWFALGGELGVTVLEIHTPVRHGPLSLGGV